MYQLRSFPISLIYICIYIIYITCYNIIYIFIYIKFPGKRRLIYMYIYIYMYIKPKCKHFSQFLLLKFVVSSGYGLMYWLSEFIFENLMAIVFTNRCFRCLICIQLIKKGSFYASFFLFHTLVTSKSILLASILDFSLTISY